jgi:cytochrome P450
MFINGTHILFLPYGDKWRVLRKTVQDVLRTSEVDKMLPVQNAESIQTLYYCLKDPAKWYDHIRRYSTSVILATVFGLRGATFDSPRVKELYHVQDQNTAINELGATPPVDIFPFLKSLPDFMSPWRVWARNIRRE